MVFGIASLKTFFYIKHERQKKEEEKGKESIILSSNITTKGYDQNDIIIFMSEYGTAYNI